MGHAHGDGVPGAPPTTPAATAAHAERARRGLGPTFTNIFVANLSSSLGDGIARMATPLLAARLTDDPLLISGIAALAMLPWLLFAIPAGILVDRIDRRRALALASAVRTALGGGLVALAATDALTIAWLYAVIFIYGAFETVYDGAIRAVVPGVVERRDLPRANSRIEAAELVVQNFLAGPLTSWLFAVSVLIPLAVMSGAFAVAVALALVLPAAAAGRAWSAGAGRTAAGAGRTAAGGIADGTAATGRAPSSGAGPMPSVNAGPTPSVNAGPAASMLAGPTPSVNAGPAASGNVRPTPSVDAEPMPPVDAGPTASTGTVPRPQVAWYRQLADGWHFIVGNRMLRTLWTLSTITALCFSAAVATLVLFALETLGIPEAWFGAFMLAGAVGGLVGTALAGRAKTVLGTGTAMAVSNLVAALALAVIGVFPTLVVAVVGFAISNAAVIVWNVLVMSLRQSVIPDELLGRVHGTWRTLLWGIMPLGSFLGGLLARIDLTTPLVVGGTLAAVLGIVYFRFLRSLPNPEDIAQPA